MQSTSLHSERVPAVFALPSCSIKYEYKHKYAYSAVVCITDQRQAGSRRCTFILVGVYFVGGVVMELVIIKQAKLLEVLAVHNYFDTRES